MPNPRDIFLQNLQPKFDSKEDRFEPFRAVLTNAIGTTTTGTVWKDENARLVYFRAWGGGSVSWALCDSIEPTLGLGVLIKFDPDINQYDVLRDDPLQRNTDSDRTSYRAVTNNDFLKGGRFQLWLDPTLFIPLSVYPTGADTVNVVEGDYIYQGERKTFAGAVDEDLSASRPAAGLHRLVGLYLDNSNTLQTINGATIATGSDATEPTWPDGAFRVAVVDIDNATDISINNIDNRKVIYTDDDSLLSGAWPPPGKVYRWDISAGLVIIEDSLADANTNADDDDVILLGAGTHTLSNKLTITKQLQFVGHYRQGSTISGTFAGDLVELATTGFEIISFKDISFVTSNAGNVVAVSIENTSADNTYFDRCYVSATSSGGNATGVYVNDGVAVLRQCVVEVFPNGTGFCVDAVDQTALIEQGSFFHSGNTIFNCDAGGELYLMGPYCQVDDTSIANVLSGAGDIYGEYRDLYGVTRYAGDDDPAADQFPKWDNANSRWIPGYVDELWESDAGAVAWSVDALSGLIGQNSRAIIESTFPLDQILADSFTDPVVSHFRDNDGSYPAGWTEADAASLTITNSIYSFWLLRGTSAETSWKYRRQTSIDFEVDVSSNLRAHFGPLVWRDVEYTADVDYYFGIYRDNAGIDENTFTRVHLHWDSGTAVWQVRCQVKDVTSGTINSSAYVTLLDPPVWPVWLTIQLTDASNVGTAFLQYNAKMLQNANLMTQIGAVQTPTNVETYGTVWIQIEQSRGAGGFDDLQIGGLDLEGA